VLFCTTAILHYRSNTGLKCNKTSKQFLFLLVVAPVHTACIKEFLMIACNFHTHCTYSKPFLKPWNRVWLTRGIDTCSVMFYSISFPGNNRLVMAHS